MSTPATTRNGHTHPHAATYSTDLEPADPVELPGFLADVPSVAELESARQHAAQVIAVQDADELRQVATTADIAADRAVAAEHRAAMRDITRSANTAEQNRRRKEIRAEEALADQAHRDSMDAAKAQARMRRMNDTVAYLATQFRTQRAVLALVTAPAVIGIVLGAVNVQYTASLLFDLSATQPLFWGVGVLELLFTLPLLGIMVFDATSPHGTPASWREVRESRFFTVKAALLVASVGYNVLPHVALGAPLFGLACLAVPCMIVVSMMLLPKLKAAFNDRIASARAEAALSTPAGNLTADASKLLRQIATVQHADVTGQLTGQRDEHGIPSTKSALRALRTAQNGRASQPDAMAVVAGLRLLEGIDH